MLLSMMPVYKRWRHLSIQEIIIWINTVIIFIEMGTYGQWISVHGRSHFRFYPLLMRL